MLLLALVSCSPESPFEGEVADRRSEVLGQVEWGTGCTKDEESLLVDGQFLARVVVASPAFRQCLESRIPTTFVPCDGTVPDPDYDTTDPNVHVANALAATRSVNDVRMSCDADTHKGNVSTVGGSYGRYVDEVMTWHQWLDGAVTQLSFTSVCAPGQKPLEDSCRFADYPWPMSQVAFLSVHESMHEHNYGHSTGEGCLPDGNATCTTSADCATNLSCEGGKCNYDMFVHSMPCLVGNCIEEVIDHSMAACGDICSTHSGLDISSCRLRGRLLLADSLTTTTCNHQYDPGMNGVGLLLASSGETRAVDMFPHGRRFGGGSKWKNGSNDTVAGTGDIWPSVSGDELVVQSDWGIGVIEWNGAASSFNSRAQAPYGTLFSHWGDGSGSWSIDAQDTVVGVGAFSSAAQYQASGSPTPREEILVKDDSGLGILNVYASSLRTRNAISVGTMITGPYGHWTLGSSDAVAGIGDFNGDGQDDILVRSGWGIGILSRTGTSGSMRTLDLRSFGSSLGSWYLGSGDEVVAVVDVNGDGRDELLLKSAWGIGLLGIPEGASRLTSLRLIQNGTYISSGWTLNAADRFDGVGHLYLSYNGEQVIIRGQSGIGMLRFSGPSFYPYVNYRKAIGSDYASSGEGHWTYNDADQVLAVLDHDGDAYDSFLIRSDWGYAIIGRTPTQTQRVQVIRQFNCGEGTDQEDQEACHGELLGSWLARQTDQAVGVLEGGAGADLLMLRSMP